MEEIRYEDLEEFVPERWTVREFIDWLEMWLTDEEMDLPFFIDYEPANSYHVFVSEEFPLGDTADPSCSRELLPLFSAPVSDGSTGSRSCSKR